VKYKGFLKAGDPTWEPKTKSQELWVDGYSELRAGTNSMQIRGNTVEKSFLTRFVGCKARERQGKR